MTRFELRRSSRGSLLRFHELRIPGGKMPSLPVAPASRGATAWQPATGSLLHPGRPGPCRRHFLPPRGNSASRPTANTSLPVCLKARAMAWPIPRVLPVTHIFLDNWASISSSSSRSNLVNVANTRQGSRRVAKRTVDPAGQGCLS